MSLAAGIALIVFMALLPAIFILFRWMVNRPIKIQQERPKSPPPIPENDPGEDPDSDCIHPNLTLCKVGNVKFYRCDRCHRYFRANLTPYQIGVSYGRKA